MGHVFKILVLVLALPRVLFAQPQVEWVWTGEDDSVRVASAFVADNGNIYIQIAEGSFPNKLICLSGSGDLIWQQDTSVPGWPYDLVRLVNGHFLVRSHTGIFELDSTGMILDTIPQVFSGASYNNLEKVGDEYLATFTFEYDIYWDGEVFETHYGHGLLQIDSVGEPYDIDYLQEEQGPSAAFQTSDIQLLPIGRIALAGLRGGTPADEFGLFVPGQFNRVYTPLDNCYYSTPFVCPAPGNGLYIADSCYPWDWEEETPNPYYLFAIRLTSSGDTVWTRQLQSPDSFYVAMVATLPTNDDGALVVINSRTADYANQAYLFRVDSEGNELGQGPVTLDNQFVARDAIKNDSGAVILVGILPELPGGRGRVQVVKLDNALELNYPVKCVITTDADDVRISWNRGWNSLNQQFVVWRGYDLESIATIVGTTTDTTIVDVGAVSQFSKQYYRVSTGLW